MAGLYTPLPSCHRPRLEADRLQLPPRRPLRIGAARLARRTAAGRPAAPVQRERQAAQREHDERHEAGYREAWRGDHQHRGAGEAKARVDPCEMAPATGLTATGVQPRDLGAGLGRKTVGEGRLV
jgi:hypothetical protein